MTDVTLHHTRNARIQAYLGLYEPLRDIYCLVHVQSIAGSDPVTHLREAHYVISAQPNKRKV